MDKAASGANGDPSAANRTRVEMGDQPSSSASSGGPGSTERTPLRPVEAMRRLAYIGLNSSPASADSSDIERLARRYRRDAQLALEGALWWAVSWPFELLGALVSAGRKWEEDYFQPTPRRRVPMEDEDL
jgi:hypothetical protein